MITNAPWYVTNQTLHDDLKVPFIKDVIQEKKYKPSQQATVIPYCNPYWNNNNNNNNNNNDNNNKG
jgi:hypothetical protein